MRAMRRSRLSLSERALALFVACALLGPGPVFAQRVVTGPNVPMPSGTTGAVGSIPTTLGIAPLTSPRATLTAASLQNPVGVSHTLSLPGVVLAGPLATAAPLVDGTAKPVSRLGLVAQALAGVREAATLLPIVGHLAAPSRGPDENAALDRQVDEAGTQFAAKLGFEAEDANPLGFEPWATIPGWTKTPGGSGSGSRGGGRSKKKGDDDAPLPDPKYPSRPIRLNDTTLPSVAMRPDRPISPLLVEAVDHTQKDLYVAAYEFKDREILKALRRARDRGVQIHIILDYDNVFPRKRPGERYRPHRSLEIQSLLNEGFDVTVLKGMWRYGISHNKFMVFDGKVAEFGSYNYSWTAEGHHYENARFTDDQAHVDGFGEYWKYLRERSVTFAEARAKDWPTATGDAPYDTALSVSYKNSEGKTVKLPKFFFNPNAKAEDWVVEAMDAAVESLDISAFTFRSRKIAEALVRAKERGVKVRVLLDKSQNDQEATKPFRDWLAFHKVKVRILAGPDPNGPDWAQKDHNKFFVVDGKLVENGSMNFTKNAFLFNYENASFTTDKTDAAAFQAFFNDMWKSRNGKFAEVPDSEPRIPTDEILVSELQVAADPEEPPHQWPDLPEARKIDFNNDFFPAFIMRPQHPTQAVLAQAIRASQKSIRIAIYEFNLPEVLEALREAKKKPGMEIELVMDYLHVYPAGNDHTGKPRKRSAQVQALMDEGFDIRVIKGLKSAGSMHNKFALFDGKMMAAGSYNWAITAENNHFENLFFSDDARRIAYYQKYFKYMFDAAVPANEAEDVDWKQHRPGSAPLDPEVLEFNGFHFPLSAASPDGHVEEILIRAIGAARSSIDIAMFSFYSKPIADALLKAKEKGVRVRLALDEGQAKLMKLDEWFAYHDFEVAIVTGPNDHDNVMFEKQHNKFMVVDGRMLETGSFNYTPNAQNNNFDNANFFLDDPMVAAYQAYFEMIFEWGWAPIKPKKPPLSASPDYFENLAKALESHGAGIE